MKTDIASVTTAIFSAVALISFVLAVDVAITGFYLKALPCIAAGLALTGFAYYIHNNQEQFITGRKGATLTVYVGFIGILLALTVNNGVLVVTSIVCMAVGLKMQERGS